MFLLPFFLPFFRSALLSGFHLAFCGLKMQQNLISLLLFITCALADFCIQFKTKTNSLIDLFNFNLFRVNQRWKSPRPLRSKRRRFLRLAYVVMTTWRCNGLHLPYVEKLWACTNFLLRNLEKLAVNERPQKSTVNNLIRGYWWRFTFLVPRSRIISTVYLSNCYSDFMSLPVG